MLDSIYHMTLKFLKNHIFGLKMSRFCNLLHKVCYNECHYVMLLNCKPLVVYQFYCMALYHAQTRRHVINHISHFSLKTSVDLLLTAQWDASDEHPQIRDFFFQFWEGALGPFRLAKLAG